MERIKKLTIMGGKNPPLLINMAFYRANTIHQKLSTITQSFDRLTERLQRAYTLIGEEQTLMKQFLDAVPSGILFFDSQSRLFYANQAAIALFTEFNPSSEEKNLTILQNNYSFYQGDHQQEYPHANHPITNVLNQQEAYLNDITLKKGDEYIPLEVWIKPNVEIAKQTYTMMVFLDLTERKKLEQILREQMKIQAEFKSANRILKALLPNKIPQIPGFDLAARYIPASAVGGDFYDWYFNADQNLILSVGDVMGQQMSSALLMTTLRSALRTTFGNTSPDVTVERVAATLERDFEQLNSFATLFQGQLEIPQKRLVYVSAGHTCGFMLRGEGEVERLGEGNPPLGIEGKSTYQPYEFQFQPGDRLVLYTRGIIHSYRQLNLKASTMKESLLDCPTAEAMVERLLQITEPSPTPYDRTVLVLRCTE